jgi:hypothetical protein
LSKDQAFNQELSTHGIAATAQNTASHTRRSNRKYPCVKQLFPSMLDRQPFRRIFRD